MKIKDKEINSFIDRFCLLMIKLIVVQSTVKTKIGEWKKNIGKWPISLAKF